MSKILKNKYNEVRSGWAIITGFVVFLIYLILANSINQYIPTGLQPIKSVFLGMIQTVCMLYILHLFYKKPIYAMGFSPKNIVRGIIYGVILGFLSISLTFVLLVATKQIKIINIDLSKIFTYSFFSSFLYAFSTGISEETFFRSYVMTSLKTTRSKIAIILISSIIFSLAHGANPGIGLLPFINIVLAGFVFGYLFIKSGSVWLPLAYHTIWNFFEGEFYGLLVSGSKGGNTVFKIATQGSSYINGGNFGPEGGIVVTLILVITFLYLYFFVKSPEEKEGWKMLDH